MKKVKNPMKYVARKFLYDKSNRPVNILPSSHHPPEYIGHGFYWQTKGGTIIDYPTAYSRVGWSNMIYISSTKQIDVGEYWCKNKLEIDYHDLFKQLK